MKKCPHCGKYNWSEAVVCEYCGRDIQTNDSISDNYTDLVDYFKKLLGNWLGEVKEMDCMTYLQHERLNNASLPLYRANFGIDKDEIILFTRDTSFWSFSNQGLVMTDKAIYVIADNENPDEKLIMSWKSIDRVVYKEYFFYFYDENNNEVYVEQNFFFKNIEPEKLEGPLGASLARHLTNMAQLAGKDVWIYNDVTELEDQGKYDAALEKLNQLMTNDEVNNDATSHFLKARILVESDSTNSNTDENNYGIIEKEFEKVRQLTDDNDLRINSFYWQALSNNHYGRTYQARNLLLLSMESSSEPIKEDSKEQFEALEEALTDVFANYTKQYEYKDRKFLMPINDFEIAGCLVNGIDTFRMSNIPSCIKFPMGHPIAGELYIGHPYNPSLYVPYESSEDIFFVDKIHELCYLLECLGAEEITITSIKGKNVSEFNDYESHISGGADVKLWSANGEKNTTGSNERTTTSNVHRSLSQKFDPLKPPYLPDGLIWYPEQAKWQRLVHSRLNGNMLEYNEFVSTSDTKFVSSTERDDIKGAAEYLWAKFNGNYETISKEQFKESTETQWKVEVKFRSLKDFENTSVIQTSSQLTSSEQDYLDNLKELLEDDAEITPRERKMLDRIRQNLGISEERAKELEASLTPQLTEDEQEYLEMYREYASEGEITEKQRNRLNKFAAALGISEERIEELEK